MTLARTVILAAICCLMPFLTEAAEWRKLQSPHFELLTSQPRDVAMQTMERLENIRAAFTALNLFPPSATDRLTVVLFSGFNEYGFYSPGHMVQAYFTRMDWQTTSRNVIVVSDFSKDVDPVLYHEFAHYCSHEFSGALPVWLEEGLASFHQTLEFEGKRLIVGKPIAQFVKLIKGRKIQWVPFGDLFSMDSTLRENHGWDETTALYVESWAVVHTLATNPRYAAKFGQFVARMRGGDAVQNALAGVYGTTIAQLRGDVEEHIDKLGRTETTVEFTPPGSASAVEEPPLEPWEARLFLTGLLVHRKPIEAERDLATLTKEFPKVPQIWEALGNLKFDRGEKAMAFRYYRTAVDLGTENPIVAMRLAEKDGSQPEAIEKAAALLDASLKRDPRNGRLRMEALAWAFTHNRYDQAAVWAGRFAESGDVRDFEMNLTAGYSHFRANDPKEAELWLKRAVEQAGDASERQRAKEILSRVESALEKRRFADRVADAVGLDANFASAASTPGASEGGSAIREPSLPPAESDIDRTNDTSVDSERLEMTLTVFTRDRGGKVAEGVMQELRCLDRGAQLVILSEGKRFTVEIDQPNNILITRRGQHVSDYEFRCGRQKPERVRIGYTPAEAPGRAGFLRILQFD